MKILLDGKPQLTLLSSPPTLGSALIELNALLQQNGRALQSIAVNGRDIPAEEMTPAFGELPINDVETVEVTSASIVDLVRESLADVEEVLPDLPVVCQSLAGMFAGDTPEEALDGFVHLVAIWTALRERRGQVVGALGISLSELSLEGRTLQERENDLGEHLVRAQEMLGAKDYADLSDRLSYDLSSLAEQETAVFALLHAACVDEG